MKKILSSLVILGLSALAGAKDLKTSDSAQCTLMFYGPTPDPVCQTYIDESGQEQEECYALGPAAAAALVDASNPKFTEANGNLYELDFDGTCNCKLVLYNKANFKGKSLTYKFSKAEDKAIFADEIWNKENASYKILCKF